MSVNRLVFDPAGIARAMTHANEQIEDLDFSVHEDLGEGFYIEADGNGRSLCEHRITGAQHDRAGSIGATNALVRVIDANFAQPLRDIPDLVSRVKAGGPDPDLDERMGRLLSAFEYAGVSRIAVELGRGIVREHDDYVKRTINILRTPQYRPLVDAFLAYVQNEQKISPQEAAKKYFNCRNGISDVLACWTLHLILKGTVTGD